MNADNLIATLKEALENSLKRQELITKFQTEVWNASDSDQAAPFYEVFADLAYDLDFYEADLKARAEDPSFYGEERLREEVAEALSKLEKLKGPN